MQPESVIDSPSEAYNGIVTEVKHQFDREVQGRRAEQRHTVSLTRAQRYVRRELGLLYKETEDEDLRQ